jgi:hypothetical protein
MELVRQDLQDEQDYRIEVSDFFHVIFVNPVNLVYRSGAV